jgi:hypothetical protein
MGATKIQVGYSSGKREYCKKGYAGRSTGKKTMNGGFAGMPTVDFINISDERWAEIFGTENIPKWKKELLEKGEL